MIASTTSVILRGRETRPKSSETGRDGMISNLSINRLLISRRAKPQRASVPGILQIEQTAIRSRSPFENISSGLQPQFPADYVKQHRQNHKRNKSQPIRMRAFKQRIVNPGPGFKRGQAIHNSFFQIQESEDDAGERSARDIARCQEDTGTLVRLGSHFSFS